MNQGLQNSISQLIDSETRQQYKEMMLLVSYYTRNVLAASGSGFKTLFEQDFQFLISERRYYGTRADDCKAKLEATIQVLV